VMSTIAPSNEHPARRAHSSRNRPNKSIYSIAAPTRLGLCLGRRRATSYRPSVSGRKAGQ
jgi:hypothetical protein